MADQHLRRVVDVDQLSLSLGHALAKPHWFEIDGQPWYYSPDGVQRHQGRWSICEECGIRFPAHSNNPGRFCSKVCIGRAIDSPRKRSKTNPYLFASLTPGECWVLGLIWADGCLNGRLNAPRATLVSTDEEILSLASVITGGSYWPRADRRPNRKLTFHMHISGSVVVGRLIKLGLERRKSFTATLPEVPHLAAFIRGYFDGDGCVGLYRNPSLRSDACPRLVSSFVGSKPMLVSFQEVLAAQAEISPHRIMAKSSIWTIQYNHGDSLRLAQFMYADDGPRLSRKKRLFDEGAAFPFPAVRRTGPMVLRGT